MKKNKDDQDQKLTEAGNLLKAIPADRKNLIFSFTRFRTSWAISRKSWF